MLHRRCEMVAVDLHATMEVDAADLAPTAIVGEGAEAPAAGAET